MKKEEPKLTKQDVIRHGLSEQTIEQLVTYMRQLEREYDVVATALESKLHVLGINLNLNPKQEPEKEEVGIFAIPAPTKEKTEEWTQWDGTRFMPVQVGTLVDVAYRDGTYSFGVTAGIECSSKEFKIKHGKRTALSWAHHKQKGDIIAYRLHNASSVFPDTGRSF